MPVATTLTQIFAPTIASAALDHRQNAAFSLLSGFIESRKSDKQRESPGILYFANCELRIEKREIYHLGKLQRVQPRVFDLLHYLIKHRHRVVTRDELLQHVWRNAYVSDSVIGRCIMKARRVIGDSNSDAPLIKTLPRAGYRFVGLASSTSSATTHEADSTQEAPGIQRVATLPFVNATGQSEFVWVEFGLASLFNSLIEREDGLSVLSILDVVTAVETLQEGDQQSALVSTLHDLLGAKVIVAVQLSREADGFQLQYQLFGEGVAGDPQCLQGADLTLLTTKMATMVVRDIRCAPKRPALIEGQQDPFIDQALVRARDASQEQRYQRAVDYLRVCVIAEPVPQSIELEYVEALGKVEHPDTEYRGNLLLARTTTEDDDEISPARLRRCLSNYHAAQGAVDLAASLLTQASDEAHDEADDNLLAAITVDQAARALRARDFARALDYCHRAAASAGTRNDNDIIARCLLLESEMERLKGAPERALDLLRRCQQSLVLPIPLHADLARCKTQAAVLEHEQGQQELARASISEAMDLARIAGVPSTLAHATFLQISMHAFAPARPMLTNALLAFSAPNIQHSPVGRFFSHLTQAGLHWRAGNLDAAQHCIVVARSLGQKLSNYWLGFAAGLCAGIAIAAHNFALARDLISDMEEGQAFYAGTALQGTPEFYAAALRHADGHRAEAWSLLRLIVDRAVEGSLRTQTCLALSWLACEERNLVDADFWLSEARDWTREAPAGLAALARFLYERGDASKAAEQQQRLFIGRAADSVDLFQHRLLSIYRQSNSSLGTTAIPRMPCLLTLLPV